MPAEASPRTPPETVPAPKPDALPVTPLRRLFRSGLGAVALLGCVLSVPLIVGGVGTNLPWLGLAVCLLAAVILRRRVRAIAAGVLLLGVVIMVWRASLTPSHDRVWSPEVARLPEVSIAGDHVSIADVRAFGWDDVGGIAQQRWVDRTYALSELRGLDMILQPLPGSTLMGHTMLSFDFGESGRLVLSIEARKERGETYGAIKGGLNQFELIYLFSEEADTLVSRARQGFELYSFPVLIDPLDLRAFFLSLCTTANNLRERPRFYQILHDNCTTAWLAHADHLANGPAGVQPDTVLTGRIGRLLHRRGMIDTELGYDDACAHFRIDGRVLECAGDPNLSDLIRVPTR